MQLYRLLSINRGVTAFVGSGGKTSLIRWLANELHRSGARVICCTSVKNRPDFALYTLISPHERELLRSLDAYGVVFIGTQCADGRMGTPQHSFSRLAEYADYVFVEADFSDGFPLKAHSMREPSVPDESRLTVCVAGLSGIGRRVSQAAHRSAIFAALAGLEEEDRVTPPALAGVLKKEGLGDILFLNQYDAAPGCAEAVARLVPKPVLAGSLMLGEYQSLTGGA